LDRNKLQAYLEENPFAKLSDVVERMLYDEIVVLDVPPASKLNVNQIASDLGISRTPVAEAIARLQAIGFVEARPGLNGFFVTDMTLRDLISLYNARTAIESEAASLCAETADDAAVDRLEAMATEFRSVFPKQDGKALRDTDLPFHKLIVESSGNKYLLRCYNELLPNITMYQSSWIRFIDPEMDNPWSSLVVHQHSAIVSAIRMRIPDLARRAMADHIRSSLNFVAYSDNSADPFSIVKKNAR
jgi:DNA-binding GntR family transcriptional regulator